MWMTREEIAVALGIVPNSVRGKVQKGQIERKVEDGKNLYRLTELGAVRHEIAEEQPPEPPEAQPEEIEEAVIPEPREAGAFDAKKVLLDQLASLSPERSIAAIEKGDEIDLATGEISRELDAKISMRKHRQIKEIMDALDRLKHGDYGQCEDCGEAVPEQRLRLFPAARLCVRCQEEMDSFEKLRENQGLRGGVWREESSEGGYSRTVEE